MKIEELEGCTVGAGPYRESIGGAIVKIVLDGHDIKEAIEEYLKIELGSSYIKVPSTYDSYTILQGGVMERMDVSPVEVIVEIPK